MLLGGGRQAAHRAAIGCRSQTERRRSRLTARTPALTITGHSMVSGSKDGDTSRTGYSMASDRRPGLSDLRRIDPMRATDSKQRRPRRGF